MGWRGSYNIESLTISSSEPEGNGQITCIHFLADALAAKAQHFGCCESAFFCRLAEGLYIWPPPPFLPADKPPSLSCLLSKHVFAEHPKWPVMSGCFCSPLNKTSRDMKRIHSPPDRRRYRQSFTQLPSGILVTLHKIVMTSELCFFYFFSRGDDKSSIAARAE